MFIGRTYAAARPAGAVDDLPFRQGVIRLLCRRILDEISGVNFIEIDRLGECEADKER